MLRSLRLFPVVVLLALTGCAAFPQHKVAQVPTPIATPGPKPSAYASIQFFRGEAGTAAIELKPSQPGMDKLYANLRGSLEDSGLFASVGYDDAARDKADVQLGLRVYNHGNAGAAMLSGIVTGLSLFVIPGAATDNYTAELNVTPRGGQPVPFRNDDAIRTWMGWIFLPVAGNTLPKALNGTLSNQVHDLLSQAQASGKLAPVQP